MLYLFLAVILLYFILFHYLPMFGIVMAFEDYSPVKGVFGSKWVGLDNFLQFFSGPYIGRLIRNTVAIGLLDLLVNFPAPIIFALLLNEVKNKYFKKTVQTISYMPYFVSTVVAAGLVITFTKSGGVVSEGLKFLTGGVSENLMNLLSWFRPIYILMGTWQGLGYGSIIYLAALSNVDQELYDAAKVDGAGYWKQTWHVTLPGITSMIIMMFIMAVGRIFYSDFGLFYQVPKQSSTLQNVVMTLDVYVYDMLKSSTTGMASAAAFIQSVAGCITILIANGIIRKIDPDSAMI